MEWQHDHGVSAPKAVAQVLVKKLEDSVFKAKTYQWVALRPMEASPKMPPKQAKQRLARAKTTGASSQSKGYGLAPARTRGIYKSISQTSEPQGMIRTILLVVVVFIGVSLGGLLWLKSVYLASKDDD
ncbi:MAG: hypothetical protein R3B83_05995 [Nitrospirales bacterium]|nr:hypothetical protein [Nitrospirales bacterium]